MSKRAGACSLFSEDRKQRDGSPRQHSSKNNRSSPCVFLHVAALERLLMLESSVSHV